MSIYNKVSVTGYVQTNKNKDPLEVKKFQWNDKDVSSLRFSLSVPRGKKGDKRIYDRVRISATGSTADFIAKYFKPGDVIMIDGNIRTTYTGDGDQRKYFVEVVVESCGFPLLSKKDGSGDAAHSNDPAPANKTPKGSADPAVPDDDYDDDDFGYSEVSADDLPF